VISAWPLVVDMTHGLQPLCEVGVSKAQRNAYLGARYILITVMFKSTAELYSLGVVSLMSDKYRDTLKTNR